MYSSSAVPPHCSWWAGLGWAELLIVAAAGRDARAQACCLPAPEQGTPGEQDVLVKRLRHMLGDLTFMEAFHHTGANHHSTTLLDGCLCLGWRPCLGWGRPDLHFMEAFHHTGAQHVKHVWLAACWLALFGAASVCLGLVADRVWAGDRPCLRGHRMRCTPNHDQRSRHALLCM